MLSAQEQRLCAAIAARDAALRADLALHVGLPTGPGGEPALAETRERLSSRLAALGASVRSVPGEPAPPWLHGARKDASIPPTVVCARVVPGRPRILIAGHLDTVHPADGAFGALSVAPGGATAVGPGCVDMKGGLVIALAALEALAECGMAASWTFVMNSDEETGSYHSDAALRAAAAEHDIGLALEPALPDHGLATERTGSGQFMIETRGRAAHVGRDFFDGVSAVDALARAVLSCSGLSDRGARVAVNVGPIEGGRVTNSVPDRARAWGNMRYPDRESGGRLVALLEAMRTAGDAMPAVDVRTSLARPPKPLTPGTRALAELVRSTAGELGQPIRFASTGGVCDGNNLQDAGLATIDTLGVRGGGLHTTSEWIELSSLVERCQLLALVLRRVSEGALGSVRGVG